MGSSFDDAFIAFTAAEQAALNETLLKWASSDGFGRVIVPNLQVEHFLPGLPNMHILLTAVGGCQSKTIDELKLEYKEACYRNVLQGGRVFSPQPVLVGRAVDKDGFAQSLWEDYGPITKAGKGFFASRGQAEDFVSRLLSGMAPELNERELLMSPHGAWVTWNPSDPSTDPFGFTLSATAVRACIGLASLVLKKGEPLLLLVYEKTIAVELLRPTVADAGLYEYFEPPPKHYDAHGLTRPWSKTFTPGFEPRPMPEAVHAPAKFHLLRIPIREIT